MMLGRVAGVDVDFAHLIGGVRVGSATGETFEVRSPIDGTPLGEVAAGGPSDVEAAVSAAREAFPAWAALGPEGRGPVLRRFAEGILARKDELAAVETADNGSLLVGNQFAVVDRSSRNISFFADWADNLGGEVIAGDVVDNRVCYDPAGVAALITPWNAPMMLSTWKLGPALAAGNTVVLKPPEWAPLTCSLLGDIALDAGLPPGVFNIVQGIGSVAGQALIDSGVDRISFTGSTATGSTVLRAAATSITPVSVELGGKSPFVVLADADLDAAARTIAGQFINAGQVCLAGTRILVAEAIEAELLPKVLEAAASFAVGDPTDHGTRVGPLIHQRQFERVDGYVQRAIEAGARPILGGGPDERGGLYYQPTILTDVAPDSEIVQNEVFGPVLTWQTFASVDEAVTLANDTTYGLAAVVFGRDQDLANEVARAIKAGTVWVNCFFVRDLDAPFGGAKRSGIGREGGTWSFDFFCDIKNIAAMRGSFTETGHG